MSQDNKFVAMIAVDRSDQAELAFDFYARNMHRSTNEVYLVHVPEGPTITTEAQKHPHIDLGEWQKLMEKEETETEQLRTKYQEKLDSLKIQGSYKTFYGKPGEALCDAAREFEADIVVMGTRGFGSVRRTILGSVSDYVIRHAHAPVVVCRR